MVIPLKKATMPTTQPGALPNEAVDVTVNILIVDDEARNLTVLETVLDDPTYRLVRASSGDEALLALMANEFAVLVLDVRMPGMTGFELAHIIKERRKTARIPIIFLTAYYNEDQHILEGYTSGAVDYLHKPVNPAVLRSKVAIFAELHRKNVALERANAALVGEIHERCSAEASLSELNATLDRRVTERTEALHASEAQLREADRRKDEFLATLAHELRNPLAPVRNAVQILRLKGSMSPETKWASDIIDRQIRGMSRLIDDLMDAARINQGKIELRIERVELASVLRDATDACSPFITECAHQLTVETEGSSAWVNADPIRLVQAFTNLLHNAAKYMNRGGHIEIGVKMFDGNVHVTVTDAGIGIASDRLGSIFEMFVQIESALARSRGGLGIGLTLTRRLIELHGGSVTASSAGLGQGSTFEVRLPIAEARHAATKDAPLPSSDAPTKANTQLRILVADDNEDSATTLAFLLQAWGHTVRQVNDGQAAVDTVADFDPQLVLLDIGMPKLNGYEACRKMRDLPGGGNRIIVAITGWGQPNDRRLSQEAGFDRHLVKPLDQAALQNIISAMTAAADPHKG